MHTRHLEFFPARVSKTLTIPETTIYDNLVMTAKKYPEKVAIEYYGGSYTYKQVLKEVEHLAGYLERTLKVKQEENVLLLMQNSPQFLIGFYAILRIRAVVVPINPMSTTDDLAFFEIGRASCRERGKISGATVGERAKRKSRAEGSKR